MRDFQKDKIYFQPPLTCPETYAAPYSAQRLF